MGATTPNLSLYKPGGGSSGTIVPDERVDVDRLNDNSDKIDVHAGQMQTFRTAQLARNQQFTGPAADIGTVSGMKLGDTYQENDAQKKLWRYDGANWVLNEGGLFLIRPTSVTNGTINDDGSVTITTQTSAVINGIFSAKYKHTRIEVNLTAASADGDLYLRLTTGGADSGPGYYVTYVENSPAGGPTRQYDANTSDARNGRFSTNGAIVEFDLYNVFQTGLDTRGFFRSIDSGQYNRTGAIGFGSASMDGMKLKSFSTQTFTGTIRVYGYL